MMQEEWGPWIDHDGAGCPVLGKFVEAEGDYKSGGCSAAAFMVTAPPNPAWDWANYGKLIPFRGHFGEVGRILRYRVRKPRGATIIEGILAGQPVEEDA